MYYKPNQVVQILTKQKGRELIMSAPLEKFQKYAHSAIQHALPTSEQHIVTIMNNSLQISVLSQTTILTLFNDTCVNCGKTFTHYIVVKKMIDNNKCFMYNGKKVYQLIPCTIEKDKDGSVCYIPFTKDHIIPQSKFGANKLENYQLMCSPCNMTKSRSTSDEDYKYGVYTKGIFNINLNMIKRATVGKRKHLIKSIERTKGGLFYIEFLNNSVLDGYYMPSGKNVLNKDIILKNVLDN